MKKVNFDSYVDDYDELLRRETSFFSNGDRYFAEYKASLARDLIKSVPGKILEFGCGTGRNIPFLRAAFPSSEFHGSDVSEKSLDQARKLNPDVTFYAEGPSRKNPDKYDLIFIAGVFHHIAPTQRNEILTGIKSRLAPAGNLVVFEHNPFNPVTRRIVSNCPYDADAILLPPRELRDRLTSTGFNVRMHGYALFFPERLGVLAKIDRHLRWLPLGGQYYVLAST